MALYTLENLPYLLKMAIKKNKLALCYVAQDMVFLKTRLPS
tara:strand:- start:249 stop:371 length:123 start_codon:yes stop_codon:yes gene_type:complete